MGQVTGRCLLAGVALCLLVTAPAVPQRDVLLEFQGTLTQVTPSVRVPRGAARAHVPPPQKVTVQGEAVLHAAPLTLTPRPPHGPEVRPRFVLRATAYNSEAAQTDSTPFVTATGAATAPGVIAVSRDLLDRHIPYGSLVRLRDLGTYRGNYSPGAFQGVLEAQDLFIVEDTLHRRKTQQIDIWFETLEEALAWGVRQVELEVVRYGREGPTFPEVQATLDVRPHFRAR